MTTLSKEPSECRIWQALWLLLLFVLCGCVAQNQTLARSAAIAHAANALVPIALEVYRAEGDAIIAAAPDKATAQSGINGLKQKWAPFWAAWQAARVAEDAYISSSTAPAADQLEAALCAVAAVAPSSVPRPAPLLLACENAGHHVDP